MDKKRNSINSTTLNLSQSFVSPQANSTRIVGSILRSSQRSGVKRKPTSPLSSRTAMSKTSLGTICYNRTLDPQTYSDITSQGLTSRLVRYGGSVPSADLSKPSSVRTAFIKNSPFPVIKLKKEGNKPSPQRSVSLSSVRIAPPDKVTFQPSSRSSIMRSGSMISMQSLGSLSRNDNEPLNPASSEPGVNPTRSVLDALQEISRKRINNEELDTERIKKQCKNITEVDGPSFSNTLSDFSGTSLSDLVYRSPTIQKRTRESLSQQGQTSPHSPELVEKQKKRLCTQNNEVLSSLSSSISLGTPKRKSNELNTRKGLDLNKEPPEETPVGSTIQQKAQNRGGVIKEVPQSNLVVQVPTIRKDVEPVKVTKKQPVVPKLTLFNTKYDTTEVIEQVETESKEKKRIRFVKPKEFDEELENKMKNAKKVEQSKLAVLLKCLAGELDDESEDMVDTGKKEEKVETPSVPAAPQVAPVIEIPVQLLPALVPEKKQEEKKKEEEISQKLEKPVVSFNLPQPEKPVPTLIQAPASNAMFSFGVSTTTTTSITATPSVSTSISVITSTPSTVLVSSPPKATTEGATNASFLFGNISNAESLPKPLISAPTSAFTATGTGLQTSFDFGTNNSPINVAQATMTTAATTSSQPIQVTKAPSFTFGTPAAGKIEAKPALPTFGAVNASPVSSSILTVPSSAPSTVASSFTNQPAPVFGAFDTLQKTPVVSQQSNTGFKIPGMPSPTGPANQPNAFFGSSNVPSAPKTSIFGAASAGFGLGQTNTETPPATTTNTQTATFGATPTVTSSFNFGSTTSATPPTFGQNSIFNNSSTAAHSQPSGGGFSFKPSATTNQSQGSEGGFSFSSGGGNQGSNEGQKASVFSRLGPTGVTTKPSAAVSPSKSLFTFTNTPPVNNEKVGAATTQSAFGANITNMSNISQTSSIFGGNTTINNNSTAQNTTIFGSTTNNPNESSNLFGGSHNTTQQPQGNDSLSGLSQIFNSTSNQASGFQTNMGFGSSINPAPPVSGTGFGSNVTPAAPVSGTSFGQKSSFNFGASNTNNNNNATNAPFAFGQSSAPVPDTNKPFAFGGGASSPPAYPGSQGSQGSQEPPKFNFTSQGGNNSPFGQQPNNNPTPTFRSASITPSPGAFNFSAVGNNNNVFGGGGSDGSTGSSTGAFNFAANQGGPVAPPGQGGLSFNIGTGGQQQGRRQIRTATRRLNK